MMGKIKLRCVLFLLIFGPLSSVFPNHGTASENSVCAVVKIRIDQELTLERQAFDAHMRINNGLTHITLENLDITLHFTDQDENPVIASTDPANKDAKFFYRIDSMENIDSVDGTGRVEPSTSADIHWLIIPAAGASNGLENGTLYYVGAALAYTMGGEEHTMTVTPDHIFVKPVPELSLDYFLPGDVYGDDPFTAETEPGIPFNMGVRVKNSGAGVAAGLKMESVQPEIIDNKQGLAVDFAIQDSRVNGLPAAKTLMADIGDVPPGGCGIARWTMTCSLSGRFISLDARFSHADELGGELTSIVRQENIHTHELVRDVLADLPASDGVRDFLAKEWDSDIYRLYESGGDRFPVADQSENAALGSIGRTGTETRWKLTTQAIPGFGYISLSDPHAGGKILKEVVRSDGKRIRAENAWLAKSGTAGEWNYFVRLFDVDMAGSYTLVFDDSDSLPHAPVIEFIDDVSVPEKTNISFVVRASDPDGTVPSLSGESLPPGADFTDSGDGEGDFDWTPAEGQAGRYSVIFTASDGKLSDTRRVLINVRIAGDTDGDTMADDWEMAYFGTLERDGTGDYDGDGISDLDEFRNGTEPDSSNAPSVPVIVYPADQSEVSCRLPELTVENSTDPDDDDITYEFELYADASMTMKVAGSGAVAEAAGKTAWTAPDQLDENTRYFWRVRAGDGSGFSLWAYGGFFVNTKNDPPGRFYTSSPGAGSETDALTPLLEVTNASDPDGDAVTYRFEIFADRDMTLEIASAAGVPAGTDGTTSWVAGVPLEDNTRYFWRASACDEHGLVSVTPLVSFFVNTANDAPAKPDIMLPPDGGEVDSDAVELRVKNSVDPDSDDLAYYFELDTQSTFDSEDLTVSDKISEGDEETTWQVSVPGENVTWYWRVKATDGLAESPWSGATFFVNKSNDTPSIPGLKNPGNDTWVSTLTPALELNPSVDPDRDGLTYRFEIYGNKDLTGQVAEGESGGPEWVAPPLDNNRFYFWRAGARDEHGAESPWTAVSSFFTDSNGVDDPPLFEFVNPSETVFTNSDTFPLRWEDGDPDSDAVISLYYDNDDAGEDGTLINDGIAEDPDGDGDTLEWDIRDLAEGGWYPYAVISDRLQSVTAYAAAPVVVDRTDPALSVSPAGGVYYADQQVEVSANEAATIYYTADGMEPTLESPVYSSSFPVTETVTLKFMAVDTAGNRCETVTEVYTMNNVPSVPVIKAPADGRWVDTLTPVLEVHPPEHVDTGSMTYLFEVYADPAMSDSAAGGESMTPSWTVTPPLQNNRSWFWRAMVMDDYGMGSGWTNVYSFYVNLSSAWQNQDIGSCWRDGSMAYDDNRRFTVKGSGFDIWGLADSFHYVCQTMKGDGEIVTLVERVENTNRWAKAGIMIRDSLKLNSKHAMMVVTPEEGTAFQYRARTAWFTRSIRGEMNMAAPVRLKLVRKGNLFTGYRSVNGADWAVVGSAEITMNEEVNIGMAVTSHNNFRLCTAVFRDTRVTEHGE